MAEELSAVVVGILDVRLIVIELRVTREPGIEAGVFNAAFLASGLRFEFCNQLGDRVQIALRRHQSRALDGERPVVAGESLGNPKRRSMDLFRIVERTERTRTNALHVPG